jgi:anti-sigma factor RsiW
MNFNDTLDPQLAEALLKRPCLDQLSRYVAGLATPVQAELIEAHMQRSPEVRMDVEALRQDLDIFSETLRQSFEQKEQGLPAKNDRILAHKSNELALAASSNEDRPAVVYLKTVSGIPCGLDGDASASPEAPTLCSTFRLAWKSAPSEPPSRIEASWPTGKRSTQNWVWNEKWQEWRTDLVLPEPWSKTYVWLKTGSFKFAQ